MMISNSYFFDRAYQLAVTAYNKNLVPVGAVLVYNNHIIAEAHNENGISHAEILCITRSKKHNLQNHSIYITLEPCDMCMYALQLMKIENIFFGAYCNKKITKYPFIVGGIREHECSILLQRFFLSKRS